MTQPSNAILSVQVAGASDTGLRRSNNEDAIWWRQQADGRGMSEVVMVVADGMGGAAAGEVASHIAVDQCRATLAGDLPQEQVAGRLAQAVERANAAVHGQAQADEKFHGMGTTLTIGAIVRGRLYVAHVGDSRCYLVRGGRATQVTRDHSWVAEEVEAGRMSQEEAASHPGRNVISRCVGTEPSVQADVYGPIDLGDGDVVVLCSDGLTDVVSEGEIARAAAGAGPSALAARMIGAANNRGGPDNISVVAARVSVRPVRDALKSAARDEAALTGEGERRLRVPGPPVMGRGALLGLAAALAVAVIGITLGFVLLGGDGGGEGDGDGDGDGIVFGTATRPPGATVTPASSAPGATAAPVSPTPAPVKTPTPSPAPVLAPDATCVDGATPARLHTVAQGDTLWGIAMTYGRDFSDADAEGFVDEIVECDDVIFSSDNVLSIGQEVLVPCTPVTVCKP